MSNLTELEIENGYKTWLRYYPAREIDKELEPYLNSDLKAYSLSPTSESNLAPGWLRKARAAQLKSLAQAVAKTKITRSAYAQYETSEENGTITLATLAKAAEALDCELVYAIRPKNKKKYSETIWNALLAAARRHPWLNAGDPRRRHVRLATVCRWKMQEPKFKAQQGWSLRNNQPKL